MLFEFETKFFDHDVFSYDFHLYHRGSICPLFWRGSIYQLGFAESELKQYLQSLNQSQGLILVTGPTGSGKTMTLYSGLNYLNQVERNICSIEDPIEIPLSGINQTAVNPKTGLTFSIALRAFLRQDPDVIMVGEIRDQETAEIAVQAAQTGHLVLSTLHTNSSSEALIRLVQMGTAHYLIASSLKLIIAQRLIRKLCPKCKVLAEEPLHFINSRRQKQTIPHWQAIGCDHCLGGYYQRTGIYELLPITMEIQQQLLQPEVDNIKINHIAQKQGMVTLYQAGMMLIEKGITSYAEFCRVLDNSIYIEQDTNETE